MEKVVLLVDVHRNKEGFLLFSQLLSSLTISISFLHSGPTFSFSKKRKRKRKEKSCIKRRNKLHFPCVSPFLLPLSFCSSFFTLPFCMADTTKEYIEITTTPKRSLCLLFLGGVFVFLRDL